MFSVDNIEISSFIGDIHTGTIVKGVGFSGDSSCRIDNFILRKQTQNLTAQIEAIDNTRNKVLIIPSREPEWQSIKKQDRIFLFERVEKTGEWKETGSAVVEDSLNGRLVCLLDRGAYVNSQTVVSLKNKIEQTASAFSSRQKPPRDVIGENEYVLGVATNVNNDIVYLILDSWRGVPPKGYAYIAKDILRHPYSREVLSVVVGQGAVCDFRQNGSEVVFLIPQSFKDVIKKNDAVLISKNQIPEAKRIDVVSRFVEYVPSGVAKKQGFWTTVGKEWNESKDGLTCKKNATAFLEMLPAMGGNAQWDVEFVIESPIDLQVYNENERSKYTWLREIFIQMECPAYGTAICTGFGTVSPLAGWIILGKCGYIFPDGAFSLHYNELPLSINAIKDDNLPKKIPALMVGERYRLKVRKVKDVIAYYINGKRIGRIVVPGIEGIDMNLSLIAPQGGVRLTKIKAREMSANTVIPEVEPILGEHGYILTVSGSSAIIDSDLFTAMPNKKYTVVMPGNIVKGEESLTVALKRMGTAVIADAGPLTSRLFLSDVADTIKEGMKILPIVLKEDTVFTESRIVDLKQGL